MNSRSDSSSPSPNALGDLRAFRFSKKPSFGHQSIASGSTETNNESLIIRTDKAVQIIISSDDEDNFEYEEGPIIDLIEEIKYDTPNVHSISTDESSNQSSNITVSTSKHLNYSTNNSPGRIMKVGFIPINDNNETIDSTNNSPWKIIKTVPVKNLQTNVNSTHNELQTTTTHVMMPSRKRIQPQIKKRKRIKMMDGNSDSDNEIDDEYEDEKNYVKDSSMELKDKALELLNKATEEEFKAIKGMTTKKFEAINAVRPFTNWYDAKTKMNSSNKLNEQILQNVMHMVSCQDIVIQLMKKCEKLALKNGHTITTSNMLIKSQPDSLKKDLQLSGYQMIGLNWLAFMNTQKLNMILADEMGLGKTVQIIAFLAYLKENGRTHANLPQLIVVPASTLDNWFQEFERWCPTIKVEKYHGSLDEKRYWRSIWTKHGFGDIDVILTTYTCASNSYEEKKFFKTKEFHYIVYDEAHKLKNMNTQAFEIFSSFNGNFKILLTGTPLQNNLLELMSLLIFLMPTMFRGKVENIKFLFSKGTKGTDSKFEMQRIEQAKRIIEPFMLRRLKADVLKSLPVKTVVINSIVMTDHQYTRYNTLANEIKEASKDKVTPDNDHMMWVTILRKLTNHPLLLRYHFEDEKLYKMAKLLAVDPTYKQKNEQYIAEDLSFLSDFDLHKLCTNHKSLSKLGYEIPKEIFFDSGKFKMLNEILPDLKYQGHRVLIFSQFLSILDLLEIYMSQCGHSYLRLDGSTNVQERQLMIDLYNMDESIFVFLLSTKAGGLGINLTAADTVIIHDIDYNPYNDKQAEDRCHRVGQTRPVKVIKFISKDSIEESMYKVAQDKLKLEQQVTGGGNEEDEADKKTIAQLLKQSLGLEDVTL